MRTSGRTALLAEPSLHRAGPGGRKHIKGGAKHFVSLLSLSLSCMDKVFLSPSLPSTPHMLAHSSTLFSSPRMDFSGLCRQGFMLSHVCFSATAWTVARQVLLSLGCPRQKYWNRLPFPSPGDCPHSGIKPASPGFWPEDSLPGSHLESLYL